MAATRRADYRQFLERLRAARVAAGLTQVQVAERLGHPQSYVSKSESGERRLDVVELVEFATLYKRPLDYFLPSPLRRTSRAKSSRGDGTT